ncbi:MAG: hypothetical protein CMK99_10195 [Pseudomonas sp.]|nr:hypothetical protein [Pseudomonas sp.]|tara:strand:+ start:48957 stop:49490 length:534 start_codon:yes stop_codon:yes gene_type:complete
MSSKSSATIVGVSIVLAAAIMTVPGLIEQRENDNLLSTTNGAVRLGKIYSESLKMRLSVTETETGNEFLVIDAPIDRLEGFAKTKVEQMLEATNRTRTPNEPKLSYESASLLVHMTVNLKTYVAYSSEYHPLFELELDERKTTAGVGAYVSKTLKQALEHGRQVQARFEEQHQLLKL